MSGGILLLVAGIWVGAQALAGNAFGRLGIIDEAAGAKTVDTSTQPDPGYTGAVVPLTQGLGPGVVAPNATAGKAR